MKNKFVFDTYGHYYDLLYSDKDYQKEVDYTDSLLRTHNVSGFEILEFGSGTGKHGNLLVEKGYKVKGIELSKSMVQKAKQTEDFNCIQGDIRQVSLDYTFDAVIALFHVVSYQIANEDVLAVFKSAANHLKSGGLFVFDVWYTPAVHNLKPETRIKRMEDNDVEINRIAEPDIFPNKNQVDVNYSVFVKEKVNGLYHTFTETHSMRHYSIPEIDLLAETAGFHRLSAEEFLTGEKPGEQTWGVCFLLKLK